jgi:hypothetical protein
LVFVLIFLASAAIFAQTDPEPLAIKKGRTYTVISTDGSGTVPLHSLRQLVFTVPEGTDFTAVGITGSKKEPTGIFVQHGKDKTWYSIPAENLVASKALGAGASGILNSGYFTWGLIIAGFFSLSVIRKRKMKKTFIDYYDNKRKAFPWLETYLGKHPNTVKWRLELARFEDASTMFSVIVFFVALAVFYLISEATFLGSFTGLARSLIETTLIVVAILLGSIVGKDRSVKPGFVETIEKGLTLECPSCHCPHPWEIIYKKITFIERKTTKTTSHTYEVNKEGHQFMGGTSVKESILTQQITAKLSGTLNVPTADIRITQKGLRHGQEKEIRIFLRLNKQRMKCLAMARWLLATV